MNSITLKIKIEKWVDVVVDADQPTIGWIIGDGAVKLTASEQEEARERLTAANADEIEPADDYERPNPTACDMAAAANAALWFTDRGDAR